MFLTEDSLLSARGLVEVRDLRTGRTSSLGPTGTAEFGTGPAAPFAGISSFPAGLAILPAGVASAEVSRDRRTLVLVGTDGQLALWDAATLRPRGSPVQAHIQLVHGVAFTPDGATFASVGQDGTISFWDSQSGDRVGTALTQSRNDLRGVAFAPDGSAVVTTGQDGGIRRAPRHVFDRDITRQTPRLCAAVGRNLTQAEWRQFLGTQPYRRTCPQWPAGN